uniref:Glycosyltransferase N-terminal domain-containing protein n=1 Tax=Cannabis sativa TaxID=3483 RepID=A0A803PE24_CANSA
MDLVIETKKPHAVCVPFPAQGHVNPMMQLAKLLHSRGFHITYVNTEFNHRRLIRSKGLESVKGLSDFHFETIPDGLPPSDRDATQDIPSLFASTRKNCLGPFKKLLHKLKNCCEVPPVTCIVTDGVMTFGIEAAREFGIPKVVLWTSSACSFMGFLQFDELVKKGLVPFKDENFMQDGTLDTPIDWIPGMRDIRLKDLPSFMRVLSTDDIKFDFLRSQAKNCLTSSAIIFNTFQELEQEVLDSISVMFPNIYTIGPLFMLHRHLPVESQVKSMSTSLWKEDSTCINWLDKKEPNSVVYVNYGSITTMTEDNLKEFAWGLANSNHSFVWIVRPDVVMGSNSAKVLSEEFFEEIKGRGLLAFTDLDVAPTAEESLENLHGCLALRTDVYIANHNEKFRQYEADYTRRLMAKYFTKKDLYGDNEQKLSKALFHDLGKHPAEAYRDEIEMLKKTVKRFYGEKPIESKSIARIVNQCHFERLTGFLKDPLVAASIIHGGSSDEDNLILSSDGSVRLLRDKENAKEEEDDSPSGKKPKFDRFPLSRWEFAGAIDVFLVFSAGLFCIYLTMLPAEFP